MFFFSESDSNANSFWFRRKEIPGISPGPQPEHSKAAKRSTTDTTATDKPFVRTKT